MKIVELIEKNWTAIYGGRNCECYVESISVEKLIIYWKFVGANQEKSMGDCQDFCCRKDLNYYKKAFKFNDKKYLCENDENILKN